MEDNNRVEDVSGCMNRDLNIAVTAEDARLVVQHLSRALGVQFENRDSSFKGEYWLYVSADESSVEVSFNRDPMFRPGDPSDEEYFEPGFKEFRILLSAFASAAICSKISNALESGFPGSIVIDGSAARQSSQSDDLASAPKSG
jgi:hypothetical protein